MTESIKLIQNQYLVREGEESTEMYYLKEGTLAVYKRKGDAEVQIGIISAGELVGEMSFLDKNPRSASVRAMSECELVAIPLDKFESTMRSMPKWFSALLNTLVGRLRKANSRVKV